jgi:hypothetical protein
MHVQGKVWLMAVKPTNRCAVALLLLLGAPGSGCCSAPRVVSNAASRRDNLQLVHVDPCSGEHTVVDCAVQPDGQVRGCRRRQLVFQD